jgi:D-alanyl-D-alanine carboxypeptidase/D-alanyl-D-alanine-endopeptidase (penicillin-binding protein 4)
MPKTYLPALTLGLLALLCSSPAWPAPVVPNAATQAQNAISIPLSTSWKALRERFSARPGCRGARLSFYLARRGEDSPLFSVEADLNLLPASTLKVITAASVVEHFGPTDRLHTRLLWDGKDTLTLVGGGDPELTTAALQWLAQGAAGKLPTHLRALLVDANLFAQPVHPPGWSWDDLGEIYAPEVRAVTLDKGYLVRSEGRYSVPWMSAALEVLLLGGSPVQDGRIVFHNADLACGYALRWALLQEGIKVDAVERGGHEDGSEVGCWTSRAIYEILRHALAVSDNQVMECLGRLCHMELPSDLRDASELRIVDGSGLSRYNLVTARSLAQVLLDHRLVSELLPVPGGEGSLKDRFLVTPLKDHLHAKTGTMSGVSGLVGEFTTESGSYVFAMLCNGWVCPSRTVKDAEDEWLTTVYGLLSGAPKSLPAALPAP